MKNGFLKWMICGSVVLGLAQLGSAATCTTWALSTASATSGTNQVLTGSANDPCTDYGLTFSNFSVYVNTGFAGTPLNVQVTFNPNGVLTFGTNMVTGQDIDLEFKVSPGVSLILLTNSSGAGSGVTETICSAQIPLPPGSCGGAGGTTLGSGAVAGSNVTSIVIAPNANGDWIFKDVSGTSGFTQQFVPEPVTISMMGAGLLALGLIGRKFRK